MTETGNTGHNHPGGLLQQLFGYLRLITPGEHEGLANVQFSFPEKGHNIPQRGE
jgi:hypothetical protein